MSRSSRQSMSTLSFEHSVMSEEILPMKNMVLNTTLRSKDGECNADNQTSKIKMFKIKNKKVVLQFNS
jgi:hypothetical protein